VLETLADRRENHPHEPIAIEGFSAEQVESAVLRLWKAGLIDAHSLTPRQVVPVSLNHPRIPRTPQKREKAVAKEERR
jgi:hypothetical protein